jgi:hypothetical protein
MGPNAGVDYNLTRVDSNTFTMGHSMLESTLTLCQSCFYVPVRDFWIWPQYSYMIKVGRGEGVEVQTFVMCESGSIGVPCTHHSLKKVTPLNEKNIYAMKHTFLPCLDFSM